MGITGRKIGFDDVMKYSEPLKKEHWPYQTISSNCINLGEIKTFEMDFDKCPECGSKGTYWQERKPGKFRLINCNCTSK